MNFIIKLSDRLYKIMEYILGVLGIELIILVFYGVIKRYIFKAPLIWGYELSILSFMWISFLGAGHALKSKKHIVFDFFIDTLPEVVAKIVKIAADIFIFLFLIIGVYYSYNVFLGTIAQEFQTIPISYGWLYSALLVGLIIMAVHQLAIFFEDIKNLISEKEG
ncbi:MAG: TRAP transporter small permease [Firmicutes bacterium]|nr:TRAP transporter small permease [Bacillota bacterium]